MTNPKEVAMAMSILPFLMLLIGVTLATSFAYNGFKASDGLILLQGSSLDEGRLSLVEFGVSFSEGRALYPMPINFTDGKSFSTSIIFSIVPGPEGLAQGVAFLAALNSDSVANSNGSYLGLFNESTNGDPSIRTFAIEFDTYCNPEFQDADENHVGVDMNSIVSVATAAPVFLNSPTYATSNDGYIVNLKSGQTNQVWIDYDADRTELNISMSRVPGTRPSYPFFSNSSLNLSVILQGNMFIGFSASTALLTETSYVVHAWSFSNEGPSMDIALPTLENRKTNTFLILGSVFGSLAAVLLALVGFSLTRWRFRNNKEKEKKKNIMLSLPEGIDMSRGPKRLTYKELRRATQSFSEKNLLGRGGFGSVYRGVLSDGTAVAVKQVSKESRQGMKEFVAEVSIIGRLRHRHLVPLLGWCPDRGLALVYQYMPNGSLDSYLFDDKTKVMTMTTTAMDDSSLDLEWMTRLRILQGVASGLVYLHEEWEQKIIHRDVKASNVLLDGEFNARLGDFGLARLYDHDAATMALTTDVAGTFGYLAPEYVLTRKFTEKVDVYGFGALVLEVVTGKRIVSKSVDEPVLADWLWGLQSRDSLLEAVDNRLLARGTDHEHDVAVEMLKLGLLCLHPNSGSRPSMRRALQVMKGDVPLPTMPLTRPPLVILDYSLLSPSQTFGETWSSSHAQSQTKESHDPQDLPT